MIKEWINPSEKLPFPYDLVCLKTHRGNFNGWWTGSDWRGLRIKSSDIIDGWTRYSQEKE